MYQAVGRLNRYLVIIAPLPRQDAPITRKWGNTAQYEAFINHWTACKVCKPNLNRYCDEGQQLEKEADKSYFAF